MTEEDVAGGQGAGETIDGPKLTAMRAHAKAMGIALVCPMRLAVGPASYNAVIVINADGTIAEAAHTGANHYQQQYPVRRLAS